MIEEAMDRSRESESGNHEGDDPTWMLRRRRDWLSVYA
jgi:hypothetical protein